MMKSYLRYEPEKLFGVIASPTCNLAFDSGGNLAISGGVHEVNVWNIRQGSQIAQLKDKVDSGYPFTPVGEVTAVAPSPDKKSIAVGYSTGEVKIFDYVQQTLLTTLRGHRSAVTCLVYDDLDEHGGLVLASGGADCDVFLWDLVANVGLARLRGHKDAITGIGFLRSNSRQNILVSASKDTQLKVWDIDTRFCIQTILGHRSEIWSLAVIKPRPKENPHAFRVLTGCTDDQIRGYRVKLASRYNNGNNHNDGDEGTDMLLDDDETVLEYYGSVMRCAPKSTVTERCAHIATNTSGSLIGTQAGKTFDVFRMRDVDDIKRKLKKRLRKGRKQADAAAGGDGEGWGEDENATMKVDNNDDEDDKNDEDDEEEDDDDSKKSQLGDELEYLTTVRGSAKLRGSAIRPGNHSGKDKETVLLSLVTNSFEMFDVSVARQTQERTAPTKSLVLDLHGHRSDVRSVVVSEDGQTIASCSSEGVKIWSAASFTCMRSCACGYGIALAFAPGSKYLVVGTKEGAVQVSTHTRIFYISTRLLACLLCFALLCFALL
jgi:U3 small nucleolar RNA-associated protein 12